jgi:serine/threonine protein kinase
MSPGTLLAGRYRIDGVLASGGMGVVYAATQLPLGRPVAVKVLRRELLKHGPFLARLRREAHTAASLKHPNIVNVTDLVLEEELAFLVMEKLEGEVLGSLITRAVSLSGGVVAKIGRQVLHALEAAHGSGLVHRDVKPDNIFLAQSESRETVKLLDFGLVKVNDPENDKLTATNAVLGTWQYMAPEQAKGQPADARADLYALGAVLYYALTKKRPYQAAEMEASTFALSETRAPAVSELRPDIDPAFAAVIERALEKDLHRRWQSAREMLEAIPRWDEESIEETARRGATPPPPPPRPHLDPSSRRARSREETLSAEIIEADIETLPVPLPALASPRHVRHGSPASASIQLDPDGREAYESTVLDAGALEVVDLASSELSPDIESVELKAAPSSRHQWSPPQKVRMSPLGEWEEDDAFRRDGARRARLRRIGFLLFAGLFVFASGLILGEFLFK